MNHNSFNKSSIDILMATYNGEKYLYAQIDSILRQTHKNWKLIIHDDGSSDNTVNIIKQYMLQYPEKFFLIDDKIKTGGAKNNFIYLLQFSESPYVMFCDQDDVWHKDKIFKTYKMFLSHEQSNKKTPMLIHTDLQVVDQNLKILDHSFFDFINLNVEKGTYPNYLICQNCVTGCTMMINRSLKELCCDIPSEALMHDWWIALVASCFGKIFYIKESTIDYRQHDNNTLGAKKFSFKELYRGGISYARSKAIIGTLTIKQAKAFLDRYEKELKQVSYFDLFESYANMKNVNYFKRKYLIIKYGLWRQGFMRNLIWFLFA